MSTVAIGTRSRVLADVVPTSLAANTVLVVGSAALVGVLAQVSFHLPNTPVPVTGQTLGVMLCGSALGWRRAGLAMSLYVIAGMAGMPWFANHASGYAMATFGYLVGFVVAGSVLGWLASRATDRTVSRALVSMIAGEVVIFAIAVPWLAVALHVSLLKAVSL